MNAGSEAVEPPAFMRWAIALAREELEDADDQKWLLDLLQKSYAMGRTGKNLYHLNRMRSQIARAMDAELRAELEHAREWEALTPEEKAAKAIEARAARLARRAAAAPEKIIGPLRTVEIQK